MSDQPPSATETCGGTRIEIATTGDYSIDTREADEAGDATIRLKPGATLKIEVGDTTAVRIEDIGGWLRIEIGGGGDQRVVLGDRLVETLNAFLQSAFDVHIHPTPTGPSGPPLPQFVGGRIGENVLSETVLTKG